MTAAVSNKAEHKVSPKKLQDLGPRVIIELVKDSDWYSDFTKAEIIQRILDSEEGAIEDFRQLVISRLYPKMDAERQLRIGDALADEFIEVLKYTKHLKVRS